MSFTEPVKYIGTLAGITLLVACGGNSDPITKELNRHLEVDIQKFDVNTSNLYPGQSLDIEWRSEGAVLFDARLYLSGDRTISNSDILVVDEKCGVEPNDHCHAARDVEFTCDFDSDNYFSCYEDGDTIGAQDLTEYFTQLPFENYLILELCSHGDCETRVHRLTFY